MNIAAVNSSKNHSARNVSGEFINWFLSEIRAPMRIEEKRIGAHNYFFATCELKRKSSSFAVCGRGLSQVSAALRCIGEYVERQAVFDFFESNPTEVLAQKILGINGRDFLIGNPESTPLPSSELWTTNGWAVHTNKRAAIENALDEALERHLLTASFLKWSWRGLIHIGDTSVDGYTFSSCVSRFSTLGRSAGFAIGRRDIFDGMSFGHFCDLSAGIEQSPKWSHALYESADKLTRQFDPSLLSDPLAQDVNWYLRNKMNPDLAPVKTAREVLPFRSANLHLRDLSEEWGLNFPLYAAFVFGDDLLPLFVPKYASKEIRTMIEGLCINLGFESIWPERMPVS